MNKRSGVRTAIATRWFAGGRCIFSKGTVMAEDGFETTHWSVVMASGGETTKAREALDALCRAYYEPVRSFIHRWIGAEYGGRSYDGLTDLDLTHDFFAEFLENGVGSPSPDKGRFRSYLLGRAKHFLGHVRERNHAIKRGKNAAIVSIDTDLAEGLAADRGHFPSDAWFDRDWARATVASAIEAVKAESDYPAELIERIVGDIPKETRIRLATDYEMSDTAIKVAIHRLRKSFRIALRRIVAETLDTPSDPAAVETEIAYLTAALTGRGQNNAE